MRESRRYFKRLAISPRLKRQVEKLLVAYLHFFPVNESPPHCLRADKYRSPSPRPHPSASMPLGQSRTLVHLRILDIAEVGMFDEIQDNRNLLLDEGRLKELFVELFGLLQPHYVSPRRFVFVNLNGVALLDFSVALLWFELVDRHTELVEEDSIEDDLSYIRR